MHKYFLFACLAMGVSSCRIQPGSNRHYADGNENKVYKLRLNPEKGSRYYYDVTNETEVKMEVSDKKVDNLNRSHVGVYYGMDRDSAGDLVLTMTYDKVHLYTKKDGEATEMDAANAGTSEDPVEKMLGALTSSRIVATITPRGEVKLLTGYKEMTDKILSGFTGDDGYTRNVARQRLEQMIGNGLIRQNMDQLFRIFPDSAVHIGDKWKLSSAQQSELNLNAKTSFTLEDIQDGIARIRSEGEIASDSVSANLMGTNVTPHLKGTQRGQYQMDTHTGMLIGADITANVEGTIEMIGREIPMTLDLHVTMKGRKEP